MFYVYIFYKFFKNLNQILKHIFSEKNHLFKKTCNDVLSPFF